MKVYKIVLSIVCFAAGVASFVFLTMRNRDILGEYYAKSSINVEIDCNYAKNIALAIETLPNPCSYWLSPATMGDDNTQNIIMHLSVPLKRPYWKPALQIPHDYADEAVSHIDNIALFVGNKLFYFTHDDIQQFKKANKDGYMLYYLPDVFYTKSFVFKNWSNYYGDINLGIKALTAFFLYPAQYAFTWFFLILLVCLHKEWIYRRYTALVKSRKTLMINILFITIVIAGLALRLNGFVRHSGWSDELASAIRYGNPNSPVTSVMDDPGNPPFYYLLLRLWFMLFGWSEEIGTVLSVLLGTGAVITIYFFIAPFAGKRAAMYAAFFMALSGFAIGYSQEMRAYIFKICMVPLASLCLMRIMQSFSVKHILLYIALCVCVVNSHYYGIIFVMANFCFFAGSMMYKRAWNTKKFISFFAANVVIAASFLPFFLYMTFQKGYNFERDFSPQPGHIFLFAVIILFIPCLFLCKDKLKKLNFMLCDKRPESLCFAPYCIMLPALIFCCAFLISLVKPMITFRYLGPICTPYFLALAAVFVSRAAYKGGVLAEILLVCVAAAGLHRIIPDIPSHGIEGYKEARAYIAADAAAHPERKAALLEDTSSIAAYYGYKNLPVYSAQGGGQYDVLYVLNDMFKMHEFEMYENIRKHRLDPDNMLKVRFDYDYPRGDGGMVFKKYF
ncbi:MAG: glycosyltransferase family 39 protein [Spirochaetaceae bacterium]|jgi:hypothetical protein|nr:glycosyltransferase family 39 protein [Spirochaetaceae bacterium]